MHNDKEYIRSLIEQCIQRDLEAWDKFIKLITPLVCHIIKDKLQRLGFNCQKRDIENLKQDILLSIWEKNRLETLRNKENAIPWIGAITLNATSNYMRGFKPFHSPKAGTLFDSLKSSYPLPYEELFNKDMQEDIDHALKSLNYKENLIIKLLILYKKEHKEISQILNMPIGTVLVYAKRAKDKLRKILKKYEPR